MVNKISTYQTAENGKFEEIVGNTLYPAISVVRWSYPDTTDAFPENAGLPPVSSVDVYSKYAVLTKIVNTDDISISLSAGDLNVNLSDVENLITRNNSLLDAVSGQINTQLGQNGFDFIYSSALRTGNWTTVTVISAAKFSNIGARTSSTAGMTNYEFPITFTFFGPITSIQLNYGAVIAYKNK